LCIKKKSTMEPGGASVERGLTVVALRPLDLRALEPASPRGELAADLLVRAPRVTTEVGDFGR
jgi:hypothetical protein